MDRLLPQVRDWFPNGESFVFMQDGAPCHTARSVKAFLRTEYTAIVLAGIFARYEPDRKCVGADEE